MAGTGIKNSLTIFYDRKFKTYIKIGWTPTSSCPSFSSYRCFANLAPFMHPPPACSKLSAYTWIILLNSHNKPMMSILWSSPIFRWGNWGSERWSHLPKEVAMLGFEPRTTWFQTLCFILTPAVCRRGVEKDAPISLQATPNLNTSCHLGPILEWVLT